MLSPPKVLVSKRDFFLIFFLFFIVLAVRFFFLYKDYKSLIEKEFYFTDTKVLNIYSKSHYRVLKLYSKNLDLEFFTTTYQNIDLKIEDRIRVKLFLDSNLSFLEYLKMPYIKSKTISIKGIDNNIKYTLLEKISSQHQNSYTKEFYQAIFLAYPISKSLREKVSILGVSHLIALSGFHLGIIWGVLFFILNLTYKKPQQLFFPYRYNLVDIGFISILILGLFLYLTNSPPSLIRAYVMLTIGWIGVILGLEIKSFELLLVVVLVALALFPKLIFSLSFWFSVCGVFYIFLILKYIDLKNRYLLAFVVSILIFILMLPVVHLIFSITSKLQLISPILSIIFTLFYPISLSLHLFGVGDIFDSMLLLLFNLKAETKDIYLNPILGLLYMSLSFGAVFSRKIFYILLLFSGGFLIYLYFIY